MKGFELAGAAGFTHALQIDADGQHDIERVEDFLALSRDNPDSLISGEAVYDASVPRNRKFGRYLTHFWVAIETLSLRLQDTMCGFRVYPLRPVLELIGQERVGRFMDFDTEIMVRLTWRGVATVPVPVRVHYPDGNLSNFDLLRDNVRITRMHTRLVFTMLWRLPGILARRWEQRCRSENRRASHWADLAERGAAGGLRLLGWCYRCLGRTASRLLLLPITAYFYLSDGERRRASKTFLRRARGPDYRAGDGFRHQLDFAEKALETVAAWRGDIASDRLVEQDSPELAAASAQTSGALLIVSHLGNVELCRATLDARQRSRLTVLVHTRHARHYNRLLAAFSPEAARNLIEVTEIGPETALLLERRVEQGGWIAIAGDRTAVGSGDRASAVPFLGQPAPFSHGPYLLAHLLGCPVYLLFCLREGARYRLLFEKFADRIALPRQGREAALQEHASRYAARLDQLARRYPFQWYNFYDFWRS
jgi:predicted LPLAT superfamily acyltransferase